MSQTGHGRGAVRCGAERRATQHETSSTARVLLLVLPRRTLPLPIQMSIDPLWFPLIQQCIRNEAHQPVSRFIQLASLTSKGHASCRTVVFRGWHFLSSTPTLKIVTDIRSDKISGLRANPWAEVCWYFAVRPSFTPTILANCNAFCPR